MNIESDIGMRIFRALHLRHYSWVQQAYKQILPTGPTGSLKCSYYQSRSLDDVFDGC